MAQVSITLMHAHSFTVKTRPGKWHGELEVFAKCVCGWHSPAYPDNDAGSARQAGITHRMNQPLKEVERYFVRLQPPVVTHGRSSVTAW